MKTICFYNQKEKVGKSTLSIAVATHLSEAYSQKVCIVDSVQSSNSISMLREDEMQRFPIEDTSTPYILKVNEYSEYCKSDLTEYDIIIFDLDSSNPEKCIDFILHSNYIFLVSNVENSEDFKVDKYFYRILKNLTFAKDFDVKNVFIVFNKVDSNFDISSYSSNFNVVKCSIEQNSLLNDISTFSPINHISVNNFVEEIFSIITDSSSIEITNKIY